MLASDTHTHSLTCFHNRNVIETTETGYSMSNNNTKWLTSLIWWWTVTDEIDGFSEVEQVAIWFLN